MRPLTIDTVLLATELTDEELPALRTAMELSHLAGAQLHIVHACDEPSDDLTAKLDDYLRRADPKSTIMPGSTIRAGRPDRVIAGVAAHVNADVIVLGPHRSGRGRSPGSTAYRVAADAERPCLVLPAAMQLPLGRVLVPIDDSGAARGALAVGLTWGSALRRPTSAHAAEATSLTVLHVETPASTTGGSGSDSAEALMNEALDAAGTRVTAAAGITIECTTEQADDVATAIVSRTASGVDLLVLGTRAHGSADGLGSVAAAVVERVASPVLLVPPRVWQHEQDS